MMSQLSVEPKKESVIRVDKTSLGHSDLSIISSTGVYDGIGDKVKSNKVRDSWSDITDILAGTGYTNGEENGLNRGVGRYGQVRLPSPLYNRNPGPYLSPTSPTNSSFSNHSNSNYDEIETAVDGNKIEENVHSSLDIEQARLEELVAMCCEYERQAQLERNGRLTQNRIKTNGSLTRDKRVPSSPSASPRVHQSFSFDTSELKSSCGEIQKSLEMKPPVPSYENMVMLPGSPRPRIRTNPSKDGRDFSHESSENRIPLCLETEHHTPGTSPYVNILPSMLSQTSQNNAKNNQFSSELTVDDDDDSKTEDDNDNSERRSSIAETNANNKYNFLGFDPRKEPDKYENCANSDSLNTSTGSEPLRAVLHSSPSWASPTIDYDSYPDYDTVEDQIDIKPTKLTLPLDDRVSPNSNEIESLRIERTTIMKRLASLKSKVSDLELQEEEQLRECEIESALVCGEIQAEREKLKEEELRVIQLKCKIQECEIEMEKCLAEQDSSQKQFRIISDRSKQIIQALDSKMSECESQELKLELYESLTQQIELLDAEKKAHEDLEFRLLEEEASWLSRREDIQKEMTEAVRQLHLRQEKLARLESPKQTTLIDIQRISHLKAIEQDRSRLKKINQELERLTNTLPEIDSCSSTTDDEVVRVRSGASVDDLDRISRVTSTTPIDISCNSLGRKTIRSLQEIERNRHLHLAKQGSLVIQEERQRVEELKKRVQDEVKAQWAQQRFNHSLTSLASDQSSLEPARDSGLGSEEPDKRTSPDEDIKPLDSELIDGKEGVESRPLSDASTCSEEQHVRLRSKSASNLQRPLTRYLPIRGEGLDLRQHVLEAGHQADLCPGILIDSTSCRGFLLKLGSRWPRWNKRWFVFDRTKRCLAYFSDKNEKKIRGGAYFQAIEEVYVDHQNSVKSPNPKVTFVVKSVNRTFHLVAPSPEAMRIWVDVIFTGAEGYQQYTPH